MWLSICVAAIHAEGVYGVGLHGHSSKSYGYSHTRIQSLCMVTLVSRMAIAIRLTRVTSRRHQTRVANEDSLTKKRVGGSGSSQNNASDREHSCENEINLGGDCPDRRCEQQMHIESQHESEENQI